MKLSSLNNLEIGSIAGANADHLYFRCFLIEDGDTFMDQTIIVEYKDHAFSIIRVIDEECSRMDLLFDNQLWCLGAFGNLYILDGENWTDLKIELKPYRYLTDFREIQGHIYAAGKNATVLKLEHEEWTKITGFPGENDFFALGHYGSSGIYVAGEQGSLFKIVGNRPFPLDVPTNQDFYGIHVDEGEVLHVCGRQGCFFVGKDDLWRDLSVPELDASFYGMKLWNDGVLLAAKDRIFQYLDGELKPWADIDAFSLWVTGGVLWAKGLHSIHYLDGDEWKEFVVQVEV